MTPPHQAAQPEPRVSADRGALMATIVHLWPYIWPSDRRDLKMRVVWATLLLLLAKFATIVTPFTFKWATDALARRPAARPSSPMTGSSGRSRRPLR
jgi:hypothetical protein